MANPLPCGCVIMGIPEIVGVDNQVLTYSDLNIQFCPLHAAAPLMREALKAVEFSFPFYEGDLGCCSWCGQDHRTGHRSDCQRQAAIAAAEPKKEGE